MSSLDCKQSSSCSVWTSGTLPFSLASDSSVGQYGTDFKQLQRTSLSHKVHHCLLFWVRETMSASLTWQLRLSYTPSSPRRVRGKVCNTCQTWGEVWARAVMVMREGCSAVSSMPNWAVPDCMERPRPDRRRLHYLYWNRWCVSGILHRRLGSFSEGSLLYLSPKLREQRCRYLENRLQEPAVPFDPKGPSHYIFIVWFT